jgi:hypothetical protein
MCIKNASYVSAWSKHRTSEFNLLRPIWIISLIAVLIFSYPPQIIELYRVIAESDSYVRIVTVALFSLIFMVVSIIATDYFITRQIVLDKYKNSVSERVARVMACLFVLVPALAILIGEIRALAIPIGSYTNLAEVPPQIQAIYEKISDRLHVAVLLQTVIVELSAFAAFKVLILNKVGHPDTNRTARYAGIGLVAIFFICQFFYIPVAITIGTLNVLMIFLLVLLLVMCGLCYVGDRYYVPVISGIYSSCLSKEGIPTSSVSCGQDTFDVRYPLNSGATADIAGSPTRAISGCERL